VKVLIAGGGTSGHINPAIAIAEAIIHAPSVDAGSEASSVEFVGTEKGLESQIVPEANYPFHIIHASALPLKPSPKMIRAILDFAKGRKECIRLIRDIQPDVVIGTGGFVCSPLISAAHKMHVPILLHEQNAFPGRSNRMMSRHASVVCTSFPNLDRYFSKRAKIAYTGNPVRARFFGINREDARLKLGLSPNEKLILAMGGSLGAKTINEAVVAYASAHMGDSIRYVLSVGKRRYEEIRDEMASWPSNIEVFEYISNPEVYMAAADLFIGRSGAITCAEIAAIGVASIFIPYPYAAQDHQTYNAKAFTDANAGIIIPDNEVNEKLPETIEQWIHDDARLAMLRENARTLAKSDAVEEILHEVNKLAGR